MGGILAALVSYHFWSTHEAYNRGYKVAQAESVKAALQYQKETAVRFANIDQIYTAEREKAYAEIENLRVAIANGSKRMSVPVHCPTAPSASTGMDYGETRAELDPATAQDIVSIAADGDEAIRQLSAAQEVIKALTEQKTK